MRYFLIVFAVLTAFGVKAQVMWQIKTDAVKKWNYAGGDEFNAPEVNTSTWKYAPDWGNAVISQSVYFTNGSNVYQKDGNAHFVAKKENIQGHVWDWECDSALLKKLNLKVVDHKLPFKYTAGALWSRKKYKYGYFECRFKSNSQKGVWPAFWLYAGKNNDEIDWFELKGERADQAHVDVHCPDGCNNYHGGFMNLKKGWGGWLKYDRPLDSGYTTISGEWNEKYMAWFVNGAPMCYFEHAYDSSMWLVLNTSVASDNSGFSPGPDAGTRFPNEFEVDYVRVWTDKDTVSHTLAEFAGSDKTMAPVGFLPIKVKKPLKFIYNKKVLGKELGTATLLPLNSLEYSLTLTGNNFKETTVEVLDRQNKKMKEFKMQGPGYLLMNLQELSNGNYTISVKTLGRALTQPITIGKLTR
jgi:beta-glucanase (GH16 family)